MKYTITLLFAMIGLLVTAQSQISVTTHGQAVKVFVDGNLQSNMPKTYLLVVNVPQGQHEIRIQSQGYSQIVSSQSLYLLNQKRYNFNVHNINGINQLVLSGMTNASMMAANGNNVVNYSTNSMSNHTTLNPNCTCGHCYGNILTCNSNATICNAVNGVHYSACNVHPHAAISHGTGGGSVTIVTNSGGITTHVQDNTGQMSGGNTGMGNTGVHPQMNTYHGNVGCYKPRISRTDFLNAIRKESFDDDKLRVAKLAMKHNAISVDDLIAGMKEFSFDDKKLDLAKYAYDHIIDLNNAYKIGNAFTFSSSKDDWHNYVEHK